MANVHFTNLEQHHLGNVCPGSRIKYFTHFLPFHLKRVAAKTYYYKQDAASESKSLDFFRHTQSIYFYIKYPKASPVASFFYTPLKTLDKQPNT